MPRFLRIWIFAALTLFLLSAIALVIISFMRPRNVPEPTGYADYGIGEFNLVTHEGKPATQELLRGKYTIVDFVFSNCPFACPGMSRQMAIQTKRLADTPVQFVSFSLDPAHDTPERLAAWAKDWAEKEQGTTARWTLLTEPRGEYRDIARKILSLDLREHVGEDLTKKIELPGGYSMTNIAHPMVFFLVGPDGRLIDKFSTTRPEEMDALANMARQLSTK